MRRGLLKTGQPRDREVAELQASVRDAVEQLAADHDVISSPVKVLVASGAILPGASLVVYAGGPSQTISLPPANGLGTSTGAVIAFLNTASVAVTLIPSRGDTLNGTTSLAISAGGLAILASDGVNKWLSPVSGGGVTDGDKGDITVSVGGTVWTIDNDAVTYAKMQNVSAASRLLGRGSAAGAGDVEEITLGTNLSMAGTVLNAAGGSATMTAATITVAYGSQSATATVVDAAISGTSKVMIGWGNVLASDENDPEMDDVTFTYTPAAGQMTVRVSAADPLGRVGGAYKINYMVA